MRYRVRVVRDVPTSVWFLAALVLIVIPPIASSWRSSTFERQRWAESDHAPADSSNEGGDDDE